MNEPFSNLYCAEPTMVSGSRTAARYCTLCCFLIFAIAVSTALKPAIASTSAHPPSGPSPLAILDCLSEAAITHENGVISRDEIVIEIMEDIAIVTLNGQPAFHYRHKGIRDDGSLLAARFVET